MLQASIVCFYNQFDNINFKEKNIKIKLVYLRQSFQSKLTVYLFANIRIVTLSLQDFCL